MLKRAMIVFLLLSGLFLNNLTSLAGDNKILIGNIAKNNAKNIQEIIIFIPENSSSLANFNELSSLDISKIKELNISEYNKLSKGPDTKQRFTKATAFILTGGLSVSKEVEASLRDDRAEDRLNMNFTRPLKSVHDGWLADNNPIFTNYFGHPFLWFMIGNYLKASGATDKEAILIAQYTNLVWEFVIEGNYVPPSPKDLATDTLGSLLGIVMYNTVLNKPMSLTYEKLCYISEKYNVDLVPQINFNSDRRAMVFAATIKFKK